MRFVEALVCAAVLTVPGAARGAACCVGSTSPFPVRVGECEKVVVGLGAGIEHGYGRWDRRGGVAGLGIAEDALTANVGAGFRLDRRWQVGLIVPVRANHRVGGETAVWGGGVGDVTLTALWDPMEEVYQGAPTVLLSGGVRLPTGRDWSESDGVLLEDVTGLPNPTVNLGVALERSLGKVPWMAGADASLGVGSLGKLQPGVTAYGSVGTYLGTDWSLLGTASWSFSWAAADGSAAVVARPRVGARVVRGERLAWRAWASADVDVGAPYLGRSATQAVSVSLGYALVR